MKDSPGPGYVRPCKQGTSVASEYQGSEADSLSACSRLRMRRYIIAEAIVMSATAATACTAVKMLCDYISGSSSPVGIPNAY